MNIPNKLKPLYAWWLGLHDATKLDIIGFALFFIFFLGAILLGFLPAKSGAA